MCRTVKEAACLHDVLPSPRCSLVNKTCGNFEDYPVDRRLPGTVQCQGRVYLRADHLLAIQTPETRGRPAPWQLSRMRRGQGKYSNVGNASSSSSDLLSSFSFPLPPAFVARLLNPDQINCPTPKDVEPKGTVLLIHGFPQTSYQFRRVITPIAKRGYHVLVPNCRGAGGSSKPWNGYTKKEMAGDLHTLVQKLGLMKEKVHVVGHDIGINIRLKTYRTPY